LSNFCFVVAFFYPRFYPFDFCSFTKAMANCVYCGTETELHVKGVPTCPDCDHKLRKGTGLEREPREQAPKEEGDGKS
jgi:hypothetical protein